MPVMHSLSKLLLMYAQQFEDQHAPQNMTIALREAAKELDRLRAEVERLRAALRGVIRVADRKTVEFDAARAALVLPLKDNTDGE